MDAKEFLKQIRTETVKIDQKREQLERLRYTATNTGIDLAKEKVQSTKRHPDVVERYLDLEKEIILDMEHREEVRKEVINAIHRLQDMRYVHMLHEKWVNGRRVEDIAQDFPYTTKYALKLYNRAMKELGRTLNDEKKENNH